MASLGNGIIIDNFEISDFEEVVIFSQKTIITGIIPSYSGLDTLDLDECIIFSSSNINPGIIPSYSGLDTLDLDECIIFSRKNLNTGLISDSIINTVDFDETIIYPESNLSPGIIEATQNMELLDMEEYIIFKDTPLSYSGSKKYKNPSIMDTNYNIESISERNNSLEETKRGI